MSVRQAAIVCWRSCDPVGTGWRELGPLPADNTGFHESRSYEFLKPELGWSFLVDDEPLSDSPSARDAWTWEPGFFAGEVTAELIRPDGSPAARYLLDVSPDPAKLGREVFSSMVAQLWAEDPALVFGTEPATAPTGELGTYEDPWLAFSRFRRYAPAFLAALNHVHARPRRTLRARREGVPMHQVRRVDRTTATAVARTPAVALFLDGAGEEPRGIDTRLDVPLVEETVDSAANRAMLALLRAMLSRARALMVTLQNSVNRTAQSETRTSLHTRWPARRQVLMKLGDQLARALRRSPFPDVTRPEVTGAGLTAIAADPLYARAWGQGWRALRYGAESGDTKERLWVSPSWEVYERWCFLQLGKLLAEQTPEWGWRRLINPHRWKGEHGEKIAELRLQPTFRAFTGFTKGRWSVSKQREPDLVLSVESATGVQFVVFDAKYRASRSNVLDAMESAHIYQDSLRIEGHRPRASLLLIPAGGGAARLEDPTFQALHRVGTCAFSPVMGQILPDIVTQVLAL
jgi:hypothetical protein